MMFFIGISLIVGGLSGLTVFFIRTLPVLASGSGNLSSTVLLITFGMIFFCLACIVAGIILTVVGYKKSHQRNVNATLENMKSIQEQMSRCPVCGLNLAQSCLKCPACKTDIVRSQEANIIKSRTTFTIPFTEDFQITDGKIRSILSADGYKEMDKNGEIVWKMGTGMMTAMHFIKLEYTECAIEVSGWVQTGMGDIGGKEMDLKGFVGIIPKKQVLKTIDKVKAAVK